MIEIYVLTPELRKKLKAPLGTLITGDFDKTMAKLKELIEREKPSKLISVGDVVTKTMIEHEIPPEVFIIDNKVMRQPIEPLKAASDQTLLTKNPAGTLSGETWAVVERAMAESRRTKIVVEGEEDLLTLVAVLCAPVGSLVVYGQPHEGIVVVKVTEEKRREIKRIVNAMKRFPSKS